LRSYSSCPGHRRVLPGYAPCFQHRRQPASPLLWQPGFPAQKSGFDYAIFFMARANPGFSPLARWLEPCCPRRGPLVRHPQAPALVIDAHRKRPPMSLEVSPCVVECPAAFQLCFPQQKPVFLFCRPAAHPDGLERGGCDSPQLSYPVNGASYGERTSSSVETTPGAH
jgi:hypothetical protein